jgi:ABC-type multidrug transport system fused ATPase/permease subunit
MALVTQDNLILPTSIGENIRYGRPDAGASEITAVARLAGAAEFIEALPEGYETVLAEGGSNLSGGQRQRIAITRALITNSPILILDEPTSALDPVHERHLVETLHSLKALRTIVLVTHRLESVEDCDQIFVVESGRILEQGTHRELIANSGHYAKALSTTRSRRSPG